MLVLDRDAATLCDRRLIAHLAADEPHENAELVCNHYLRGREGALVSARATRGSADLSAWPAKRIGMRHDLNSQDALVTGRDGNRYRLSPVPGERCILQMRWCRAAAESDDRCWQQVSLREVVGAVESYEPMRTLTEQAIARHDKDHSVSVTRLRC